MSEQDIEQEIMDKKLNAPRITPMHIDSCIKSTEYIILSDKTTICHMTLVNNYKIVGTSFCVSPENFDKGIGEKIAFENARNQIWPLEGYALQERLYQERT